MSEIEWYAISSTPNHYGKFVVFLASVVFYILRVQSYRGLKPSAEGARSGETNAK